jgi:hypothetical protein
MEYINGILLLYHHPPGISAPTIYQHIRSFKKYSASQVYEVNTENGFPRKLHNFEFSVILFHYSLFGTDAYKISEKYKEYLCSSKLNYRIAFFQDEHHHCKKRFEFINEFKINCIFSLLKKNDAEKVYLQRTSASDCVYTLPGYIDEEFVRLGNQYSLDNKYRDIDIGYRARDLHYYMGGGAQEKSKIGRFFVEQNFANLKLDINTTETGRLYGDKWYKFLARCKAVLGVETGVSVFDLDDSIRERYLEVLKEDPKLSFSDYSKKYLTEHEDKIYYRTIGPRHFEAVAFRVTQILFEGEYSGLLSPYEDYIPLKKDFSNINEALEIFNNPTKRENIRQHAYSNLLENETLTYKHFVTTVFDKIIVKNNIVAKESISTYERVSEELDEYIGVRKMLSQVRNIRHRNIPGKKIIKKIIKRK